MMSKMKKRIFTLIIACIMCVTTVCAETVIVNAEEFSNEDIVEVLEGKKNETVVNTEEEMVLYRFIPNRTGRYHFYSMNSGDTYGVVCDSDKNIITEVSDDGNRAADFSIETELMEGQIYYLGVDYYQEENSGTITWMIEKEEAERSDDAVGETSENTDNEEKTEEVPKSENEDVEKDSETESESKTDDESGKKDEKPDDLQLSIDGISYIFNENDISIGAACTTNASNVTYKWVAYNLDTHSWKLISNWSESNWSSWKPEKGNYWLQVQVQAGSGLTAEHTICFATQKDYSIGQLTLDGFCYLFKNDRIDIGTAYTTNCTGVQFKWMAYNLDTKVWSDISDWNTGNWTSWMPTVGNYWVVVQAKISEERIIQNVLCFAVDKNYGQQLNLNGICYIFQNEGIDVGVAYDYTDLKVEFRWMAYNLSTEKWITISDWSGSNWASWNPQKGNYWLMAQARMSDGTMKSHTICFCVDKDYDFSISNISTTQYSDKIVLNADCLYKRKTIIFKWMIYNVNNSTWETLLDWTDQESAIWNPKPGDYWIYLQASDGAGNMKNCTIGYHVTNNYGDSKSERTILNVGAGKEFSTINSAIEHAIELGVSNNKPIKILIDAGVYNEQIVLNDIHGLEFEGESRANTIIEYQGEYPDCVIHAEGDITFSGLTIREKGSTYAVHVDPVNTEVRGCITFSDCVIKGGTCALGYGSGDGTEVHLLNCELSASDNIVYAHNSPYSGSGQKLVMNGCTFIHTTEHTVVMVDDAAYSYFHAKSPIVIIAVNNTYNGSMMGRIAFRKDIFNGEVLDYIPKNEENIILSPDNKNNINITGLERH